MNTPTLFVVTVLIWGTSWIAIAAQVTEVPVAVSIFYRFALAGIIMLVGLAVMGKLQRPKFWRFVILQALCLFCLNFIAFYTAASIIPSGLVAVVFSFASIFNAINGRFFFGEIITRQTYLAAGIGTAGIGLLFWDDLAVAFDPRTLQGIGWAILGTALFSWGNMASRRNSLLGITPLTANSWGMGIGALCLLLGLVVTRQPFIIPQGTIYWIALVYLAVLGSVVGFTTYLLLVGRIGSAKAGYVTVLFPVVALTASALFEGYQWTTLSTVGLILAGLGNAVMFKKPRNSYAA